ncbi:MAG: 2'-5' RNA ligase family protein [Bacteroidota bacterium]
MRLFIAIDVPERSKNLIEKKVNLIKKEIDQDVKWVTKHNWHITLKFLGDVDKNKVSAIEKTLVSVKNNFKNFLDVIKKANLKGKKVAIFGIGDSSVYPDSFADALGVIFEALEGKGVTFVGEFSTKGYNFEKSLALFDEKFVGLPLDDDSDDDQNKARIAIWSELLNQKMN